MHFADDKDRNSSPMRSGTKKKLIVASGNACQHAETFVMIGASLVAMLSTLEEVRWDAESAADVLGFLDCWQRFYAKSLRTPLRSEHASDGPELRTAGGGNVRMKLGRRA